MSLKESPYAAGIAELLRTLESSQLLQLANTATNQHIIASNVKEAVDIILRYTENLEKLFSYRRITCQLLFEYLHKKKVPVRTGESKLEMIERVKALWKQKSRPKTENVLPLKARESQEVMRSPAKASEIDKSTTNISLSYCSAASLTPTSSVNIKLNSQDLQVDVNLMPGAGMVRSDVFAREFCKWFFVMLNRLQPQGAVQVGDTFSSDVFMANCTMDIYLYGAINTDKHATGQNNAYTLLKNVCTDFQLMFVPEIGSGVRAEMSQHGLVKLYCVGTLHQGETFIGVFEQEFGLVKCPQGEWKILMTKLSLKQAQKESVCLPALPQGPVFEIPL